MSALEPARTVAELRELQALTGDAAGAQRVAWTPVWLRARDWLAGKLAELGAEQEIDEAGNQWGTLPGRSSRALLIGGHLDSVPGGGWLDGCLNVLAGLEVLRGLAAEGSPPLTVRLVSWADEEGARFGRSLFGSSACSGTLSLDEARALRDREGTAAADALRECGVDLDRMKESGRMLRDAAGYLELHIEQGPVLERLGLPLGVVTGTCGVERYLVRFRGQSAHAGSTPMDVRRDAAAAGARLTLEVREVAKREQGVGTVGRLTTEPGIPTAVPGECTVTIDQRHLDPDALARMLEGVQEAGRRIASEEDVEVSSERIWRIEPIPFDPTLLDVCEESVREVSGTTHRLPSGPLHDAAEMARVGIPTAMLFVQSLRGLSHTPLEDTLPEHLELSVRALDGAVRRALDRL
jgi:N-carbamoyl-L-amino-acid hydrolase